MIRSTTPVKIFISHAHKDQHIAETLIDYLLNALELKQSDIRCTSVPNYMIPAGELIVDRLRNDVDKGIGIIALLSNFGIDSIWVKYELGAGWVKKKTVIPVLGPSLDLNDKRLGPIRDMPCVSVDDQQCRQVLLQFINQLANELEIPIKKNSRSNQKLQTFIDTYRQWGGANANFSNTVVDIIFPDNKSLVERIIPVKFNIQKNPTDGFIWVAISDMSLNLVWPKEELSDPTREGEHTIQIVEGGTPPEGKLGIYIIGVGHAGNDMLEAWKKNTERTGNWPGLQIDKIPGSKILGTVEGLTLKNC